jgi:hypothetical protein
MFYSISTTKKNIYGDDSDESARIRLEIKWWGMFYLPLYCIFFAESFDRSNQ